jgi:hypothetical protein
MSTVVVGYEMWDPEIKHHENFVSRNLMARFIIPVF